MRAPGRPTPQLGEVGDGAFYYLGVVEGLYMHVRQDGALEAGSYEGGMSSIADSVKTFGAQMNFGSYEQAHAMAARLGGERFATDIFGEAEQLAALMHAQPGAEQGDSVADVAVPDKSALRETERDDGYTSVLKAIENGRKAPKAARKAKGANQKSKDGDCL